jgi:hypothetical protein
MRSIDFSMRKRGMPVFDSSASIVLFQPLAP